MVPLFERLQIESQSNCNRSCWFCPRTYDRSGKYLDGSGRAVRRQMPTAKILALLDEARAMGFEGLVGFHHYSEPLLDPRNPELARAAKARGLQPYLHTNGDAIQQNDRLCQAVQELYAFVVVGLYDYRNEAELEEAKAFWRARLPKTKLEFSPIGLSHPKVAHSIGVPRARVPSDPRLTLPDLRFDNAPCHRPMVRMLIQYDGEVCLCCEDTTGTFGLGNVHQRSLAELWGSARHSAIVQELAVGRRSQYELCRNCPLPPTGPPPEGQRVVIALRRSAAVSQP